VTTLGAYHTVESFCTCGKTIYKYVDFDGKNIIYRENWNTPTGWVHKSDQTVRCGDGYIENDKDFPIRHFKVYSIPSYEIKRQELFNSLV
jgi:hypothetical protein